MKLHALLGYPVSENFVSWCQTLKNSPPSFLCIQEHLFHLPWLKNVYIWSAIVLCMMSGHWSRILSGKPFKHIFHGKVKNITISSDPHSPFHCHAYIIISLFHHFFHDLWLRYLVYFRVTLDLWLILIHRDLWNSQKWQKPLTPFKVFVYWKGVVNRSKFTNIFFLNFHLYFRRHSPLMPPC